ncbi:enoyl-CoA hydratase/isomerase family protein [Caballeronia sp. LZ008]|uniref:enoyl-CoA hydratase/isomerase family protein n=1 Tax=Caballeronia sp. LZ008 TaxID=3038560 RepID=UPI0028566F22|nr:enoyl-CoA hydratase/isomerase family protein [Caballeronia sp. LZ008]MDR5798104.1 enoyl-CoA hydratase/isomerase family protein [Caballeronia sp. LZ008]
MPEIKAATHDAIRILTISNERKRNAFAGSMSDDLLTLFGQADADPAIRAVIVTGDGDIAFSSGHDLNDLATGADAAGTDEGPMLKPMSMKKPVIAAVNGHCYAAALILAMSCDLRVASENATFGSPGARLGMLPEGGQIGRLPLLMGRSAALELMLTSAPLSAADAFRCGFVSRVVPPGQALEAALSLARAITSNAPAVVSAIKKGVLLAETSGVPGAQAFEHRTARVLEREADAVEGVKAFLEKRKPIFTNVA